jgi:ribosomal-protein-serine acetyltransferase
LHSEAAAGHDQYMDRPPETISNAAVTLRRWRAGDAELSYRLVRDSIEHLSPWMAWATPEYSLDSATGYVERCEANWADGEAFQYAIFVQAEPVGSAGLMARIGGGGLEIGYWVHPSWTGRGVATSAAAALTDAALALPAIDRVEIHHDVRNAASGRVPAKLGYSFIDEVPTDPAMIAPGDAGTMKVWRITR